METGVIALPSTTTDTAARWATMNEQLLETVRGNSAAVVAAELRLPPSTWDYATAAAVAAYWQGGTAAYSRRDAAWDAALAQVTLAWDAYHAASMRIDAA